MRLYIEIEIDSEKELEIDRGTEAVLFIAHTPHGELKKRIQDREDKLTKAFRSKRVKVVERGVHQ